MQFIKIILMAMMALVLVSTVQAIPQGLQNPPANINVSATALTKQGSNYSANITVIVTDPQGNPSPQANVIFATSKGNLTIANGLGFSSDAGGWIALTDNNGMASAVLTLTAPESVNISVKVGSSLTATIIVAPQPSSISITAKPTPVMTQPSLPTPGTPEATTTGTTIPGATTPGTTTTAVTTAGQTQTGTTPAQTTSTGTSPQATTPPGTPGFGIAITILTILGALKIIRRK
jgi:hypothetical protein